MLTKFKTQTLIIAIILTALFWAISTPQAPRRVITPDLIIQPSPITLDEALSASLASGDGRKVDFSSFGLSWEA